jgi:phosphoribosylformimino-5-aminoimidazole carboxamide ribotide isomerase
MAKRFADAGITHLHVVDLDGARGDAMVNTDVIGQICRQTNMIVDLGGGIKTHDQVVMAFDLGVAQVTVGSAAVRQPDEVKKWFEDFGSERLILGVDARRGKVAIQGWEEATEVNAVDLIRSYQKVGLKYCVVTDIDRDGMLTGPSIQWYRTLMDVFPEVGFVASGGIASEADLDDLASSGLYGCIIGKAYYEGRISLDKLADYAS